MDDKPEDLSLVPILGGVLDGEEMAPLNEQTSTYVMLKVGENLFFEHEYELRVIKYTCSNDDSTFMDLRFVEKAVRALDGKEAGEEWKKKRPAMIFLRIEEDESGNTHLAQFGA